MREFCARTYVSNPFAGKLLGKNRRGQMLKYRYAEESGTEIQIYGKWEHGDKRREIRISGRTRDRVEHAYEMIVKCSRSPTERGVLLERPSELEFENVSRGRVGSNGGRMRSNSRR